MIRSISRFAAMAPASATDSVYDLIVVGAGVVGAATAWAAARGGYSVLLLEQGQFGHNQAGLPRVPKRGYSNIAGGSLFLFNLKEILNKSEDF